ncbi:MAG: radical SAM protein [Erysipelotrichaceae bacterium]|nr:radical SAM protein [Erysipelotrichaceae bacterium]
MIMDLKLTLTKTIVEHMIDKAYEDPDRAFDEIFRWADLFRAGTFEKQFNAVKEAALDPDHPYYPFIRRIFTEVDPGVTKKLLVNFFVNAVLAGWKQEEAMREKYQCNIPWAILLDPTSACNLHCTGCWAAEYGHKLNLSYEEIDDIITQGKELGVYMYIYTGGEPLVRKKDLIRLCEKHDDCVFLSFTNGTLIDEDFAEEMLRVGNFVPAISLEGFEDATDERRGAGVYQHVQKAMKLLNEKKLVYGISACYTRANYESISSEEFYDSLIAEGARFVWFFHYMPVGNDASLELLPTVEQRIGMIEKIRRYRSEKPLFAMDFQNDAQYVGGCIAGGRRYLHINANGDVDPCVFIHYSTSNIRQQSLLECLQSPLMMQYHDNIPFNENMLKPCPMLENSGKLTEMVNAAKAHSTDLQSPQSAEDLCANTKEYAENWSAPAEEVWEKVRPSQEA